MDISASLNFFERKRAATKITTTSCTDGVLSCYVLVGDASAFTLHVVKRVPDHLGKWFE